MVGADSVMISAICSAHQSSYLSSVGRCELLVAEVKAATLEMGGRKADTVSQRMSGVDQVICSYHSRAV